MKLSEMLDHVGKDLLDDRTELQSGDPDSLFSDELIVRYLNEAQRILCRRAWVITETGIAPAGILTLATGKTLYNLHKSVLRVHDGTPTGQLAPLGRADDINLRNPYPPSSDAFDIGSAAAIAGNTLDIPGPPLAIASDAGSRVVRVAPTPTTAQNGLQVILKVTRLPICWLDVSKPDAEPEVPSDWHMVMCGFAANSCLRQSNVDATAKAEAREGLATFDAAVSEARRDRQRAGLGGDRWTFASTTAIIR